MNINLPDPTSLRRRRWILWPGEGSQTSKLAEFTCKKVAEATKEMLYLPNGCGMTSLWRPQEINSFIYENQLPQLVDHLLS